MYRGYTKRFKQAKLSSFKKKAQLYENSKGIPGKRIPVDIKEIIPRATHKGLPEGFLNGFLMKTTQKSLENFLQKYREKSIEEYMNESRENPQKIPYINLGRNS